LPLLAAKEDDLHSLMSSSIEGEGQRERGSELREENKKKRDQQQIKI